MSLTLPQKSEVVVQIPYAFAELRNPHRYKVFWGGRGGAKSWAFANQILDIGVQRKILVLCTREIQKSIRDSVHSLLAELISSGGYEDDYQVLDNEIRGRNGTKIIFAGLWRNPDALKSVEGVDICWIEEANTVSENSWRKLIPSIRKPGSEIWVSFNPALKTDSAYQRFIVNPPPEAYVRKVSYRDNPWLTQELIQEMRHLKATDEDEYDHVYEGELKKFADGAIFGTVMRKAYDQGRITANIPVESYPVHTCWDLGRNDHNAIWWFQRVGGQTRFIDYYQSRLVDLDHYAEILLEKKAERGFIYGDHYLPHDVETIVLGSGNRSRREILEGFGVKPIITVERTPSKDTAIAAGRDAFAACWFDSIHCEQGIDGLANYHFEYDEKNDTHHMTPKHDWASNPADAFMQYAQGYRGSESTFKEQMAKSSGMEQTHTYARRTKRSTTQSTAHIL